MQMDENKSALSLQNRSNGAVWRLYSHTGRRNWMHSTHVYLQYIGTEYQMFSIKLNFFLSFFGGFVARGRTAKIFLFFFFKRIFDGRQRGKTNWSGTREGRQNRAAGYIAFTHYHVYTRRLHRVLIPYTTRVPLTRCRCVRPVVEEWEWECGAEK